MPKPLKGMSIKEAYRKAGIKPDDIDFMALGMDTETVSKELEVVPRNNWRGLPKTVGPKDLLRTMGYSANGHPLPQAKWKPGAKDDDTPMWGKADGYFAPKCPYSIPYVTETDNDVSPYLGCERYEDLGAVVRFHFPYVFLANERKWYRLTGGTPMGESGLLGCKHFAQSLRMVYEDGTMKAEGGWTRKYPIDAHELLGQMYYRGWETHAPSYVPYYLPGKSHNDIECFDARKAEFSPEELARQKTMEMRRKKIEAMQEKARALEKQQLLKEIAESVKDEDDEFKRKQRQEMLDRQSQELDEAMSRRDASENMMKAQAEMLEKIRSEMED